MFGFNLRHVVIPPCSSSGWSEREPTFLHPLLDMGEDVAFTLSDRERAFAGVHASEVLFDGKVLAKTGCEASDAGDLESCYKLSVCTRGVIALRHIGEVLALGDEVFFCESCHGHSAVCDGEPFPILFIVILYHRSRQICTIVQDIFTRRAKKSRPIKDRLSRVIVTLPEDQIMSVVKKQPGSTLQEPN
jgi:hypothetical protein